MLDLNKQHMEKAHTDQYGYVFLVCLQAPEVQELTDSAFRVWVSFNVLIGGKREGWVVSSDQLIRACGLSRSTFFRAVKVLKDKKLLSCTKNGEINGRKTLANSWMLLHPPGVNPKVKGRSFGVKNGIVENESDTSKCHSYETNPVSTVTHIQEANSCYSSNKQGETDTSKSDIEKTKNSEALNGFLEKKIAELQLQLLTMNKDEILQFLYKDETIYDTDMNFGDLEWHLEFWDEEFNGKTACATWLDWRLCSFSAWNWGSGFAFIMDDAIETFGPSNQERSSFLTEAIRIVQRLGRPYSNL